MEYRDYTKLQDHRPRMWKISDGITLEGINGIDLKAFAVAVGLGMAAGIPVFIVASLINLIPFVVGTGTAVAIASWFYITMTKENIKDTPVDLLKKYFVRQWQPARYARGVAVDWAATNMQWQVLFWRPDWCTVRIGGLRRWDTYDPAPVGDENRKDIDITGAGEIAGWRHFMTDVEERNQQ